MRMSQLCQERVLYTLQAVAMLPGVPGDAVFCASCLQGPHMCLPCKLLYSAPNVKVL